MSYVLMGDALPASEATLDAIEQLYRRDLERFLRVAAALVGDRDAARDAVHEGFAQAVAKRESYSGRGPLEAWLWRVVINRVRNYRRDARSAVSTQAPQELGVQSANGSGEMPALHAALARLPERQRLVVFLHYFADLDYASIAATLEIREGTVAATLNAARASLRRALTEEVAR